MMLAELGAEVIKVEDPRGGDPMRTMPPLLDGRGLYHLLLDRGKKSVALDLKDAGDRASLDRLIDTADVVVESFRPRTARRFGVDAASLRARWPRLIHCAITGYGQTGPYAERPGHDLNYVSLAGMLAADRPGSRELPRMFMADVGGGAMHAAVAILAALVGRARTGEGASLDVSMHEAMLYWVMLPGIRDVFDSGVHAVGDLPTFGRHACYNVYRAKDGGYVALGALELKFWTSFCNAVGRPDLIARHLTSDGDQARLIEEVGDIFATRTTSEWVALADAHDVCLTPVNTPASAFADLHVSARGVVVSGAGLRAVRAPFAASSVPLGPAPAVDADRNLLDPGNMAGSKDPALR
jgi:crotonobetainyl-CoA:carnitine CoA-transferase CaiB-like acyl-CoA transferase